MKTSRKNPFAQATAYKAPTNRLKNPFGNIAWDEPVFSEIKSNSPIHKEVESDQMNPTTTSHENQSWMPTSSENKARTKNPFAESPKLETFNGNEWSSNSHQDMNLDKRQQTSQINEIYSKMTAPQIGNCDTLKPDSVLEEPPLLEDLGIDLWQIKRKIFSIISMKKSNKEILNDADLAGPLMIAILLGTVLLFQGKVQFGYTIQFKQSWSSRSTLLNFYCIYGYGLTGWLSIFGFLRYTLGANHTPDLYTIMSILGYCLLPFVLLAAVGIFIPIYNVYGGVLSLAIVSWSTFMATQFIMEILSIPWKRMIIAGSVFTFYSFFLTLTLF